MSAKIDASAAPLLGTGSVPAGTRRSGGRPARPGRAGGLRLSLRLKGVVAFALLLAYGVAVGFLVGHERAKVAYVVQQLDAGRGTGSSGVLTRADRARQDAGRSGIVRVEGTDVLLREGEFDLFNGFERRSWTTMALTTFGAVALFGVVLLFFTSRLASDIRQLEMRATAIVKGRRLTPITVKRNDEIGRLRHVINGLESEIGVRERQQELALVRRFHQEKMAAVGSLAAAVAHEVANPINAISGIAQHTIEVIRADARFDRDELCRNAEMTIKQTERIGSILRQIADLSAPRSAEPALLDLNELVGGTCSFIRYDRRLRQVDLRVDLDRDLPPAYGVGDQVTQVLMNLLINAADALGSDLGRPALIQVTTRRDDGCAVISVSDNGHGMAPEVLAHAFDESFTTKPAGTGRGIGLYLCKTLLEEMGGEISLSSVRGRGTTATVRLPCPSTS